MATLRSVRVPVFYDFSSTICYFTHRVLGRLGPELDELGVVLDWMPIDLVGITAWQRGEAFGPERTRNLERLSQELGVPVATPSHWMDSRAAMAVALDLAAARDGNEERWREAVWTWVYEDARTLDEPAALDAIAQRAAVEVEAPGARGFEQVERRTVGGARRRRARSAHLPARRLAGRDRDPGTGHHARLPAPVRRQEARRARPELPERGVPRPPLASSWRRGRRGVVYSDRRVGLVSEHHRRPPARRHRGERRAALGARRHHAAGRGSRASSATSRRSPPSASVSSSPPPSS